MIPRLCNLPVDRSVFRSGPRQTGKSTLASAVLPEASLTIDLLIEKHGKLRVAAEIKSKSTVGSADIAGLRSFGDHHCDVPVVVISLAPLEYRIGGVRVLPYRRFLDDLERWLAWSLGAAAISRMHVRSGAVEDRRSSDWIPRPRDC